MPRQEALITPSVMKWAREKRGFDIPTAAKKIGRPEADIEQWESGELLPTFPQAILASKAYQRSLAVFYLPEPPKDFDTLRDFRYLYGDIPPEYSPTLLLLIREVQARKEWLSEWRQQEGVKPIKIIGSANLNTPVKDIVSSIRQTLGISLDQQKKCEKRTDALKLWIEKSESIGINICRQGTINNRDRIEPREARGFVLIDKYAPFIYLNTNDAIAAQLFTLAHELVHIWINSPGISNLEIPKVVKNTYEEKTEFFCNKVASEMLLDNDILMKIWSSQGSISQVDKWIKGVSDSFNISESMIALKLKFNNLISLDEYYSLRDMYNDRWLEFKKEEKRKREERKRLGKKVSGPSPHLMKVRSNGYVYTQTVLSAYNSGAILGRDASGLLGVKVNNLDKVAKKARGEKD